MGLETDSFERMLNKILDKQENLGTAENMEIAAPDPDMEFGDSLILAMKREDKAFELYSLLAEISEDDDLSVLFLGLAKEEKHHRIKIEKTYKSLFGE
jgi:rubrerythrin